MPATVPQKKLVKGLMVWLQMELVWERISFRRVDKTLLVQRLLFRRIILQNTELRKAGEFSAIAQLRQQATMMVSNKHSISLFLQFSPQVLIH